MLVQQQYVADTFVQRWQARQRAILNAKPTIYQQDYIIYQMLQFTGILTEQIFNIIPAADVGAVRAMVRMIAGVEDYARINAHYSRRHYFPSLDGAHAKRCCLHCFCNRGVRMLDSEWHAVFDCPLHVAARSRFRLASGVTLSSASPSAPVDLVRCICSFHNHKRNLEHFSRFVLNIRSTRRHHFRQLTTSGPSAQAKVAKRIAFRMWRDALQLQFYGSILP